MKDEATDGMIRDCLVAVVNNDRDLQRFAGEGLYRIPARAVGRTVAADAITETNLLALYQTAAIGAGMPSAVELWGEIEERIVAPRRAIVPDEPHHPAADEEYHLIRVRSVERLDAPIVSRRPRRITFLRTTSGHLFHASDVNELILGSPAEERLWRALRERSDGAEVERRYYMRLRGVVMEVDFALFYGDRALAIQCSEDGPPGAYRDDVPDAWRLIRFSPCSIDAELAGCLEEIESMMEEMRGNDT